MYYVYMHVICMGNITERDTLRETEKTEGETISWLAN